MTDRTVVYRIQADVTQARAQVAALGASVKKSADDMTAATKEGNAFRGGLTSLGNTAGKVGLVAAVGLGAAVKKAADFDQSMSNVQAATHETASAMDDLRAAALKAGADTAFSATEAAAGIENLAKAGISTQDILGGALAGALDLAAAGGMEVADAAEAAAGAMAQFKLEGSEATHVADLLAAGAGKAQGDVSDMVMALKQAGTVSAQTGLSIEETTGSLAAMAEQSLLGSDAGTSFKTMLGALTPNSKKAAEAMEQYNIHAFDAQGNFVGMTELAGQLRTGLGGLTDEQRAMTMETIFGSDAVRAASIIYDNGAEGIQGWIDKTDDAGYAAETAAIKLDNLKGDIEALGGSLETALIGTGDGSQGMLRSLTQNLTATVNAYNDLGSGAKKGVAVTLTATALLGGGLFVFSRMVQSIAATRLAMTQLGISATTTSRIMSGLGKAGFGLAGLAAGALAAEQLRKAVEESLPGMSELSGRILAVSEGKVENLGKEFDSLSSSIARMDPGYIMRSSDAITGLLTLGILDGKEIDGAKQEIEALDAALANLASSGGTDVAAKAFGDLAAAQGLSAAEVKDLLVLLPTYKEALASNENQAKLTGEATDELADAHPVLTQRVAKTTEQLKAEADALEDARKAAHETAAGFVNLGEGLDDAKVSLGQWIAQMANQADALNNFMNNAKAASKRGLRDGLINDLQDAGTAGALRMKQLANATDDEIARANKAWKRGQDAMQRYVDFKVPPKKIDVDNGAALSKIESLEARLRAIKDEDVNIVVREIRGSSLGPRNEAADGGTVPKTGKPYADRHLYLLADGEEVISNRNGQADRHRALLKSINGGLADGGTTGKKPRHTRAFSVTDNTDSLQAALDRLTARTDASSAAVEDQRRALDGATEAADFWGGKMSEVAKATVSGFDTGLFAKDSNPWAAGAAGGPLGNLNKDIAGLEERSGLQAQLAAAGLSGDALAAILSQGTNADIAALLSSGQAGAVGAAYNQRAALQGSVGAAGGQAAYGAEYGAAAQAQQQQLVALGAIVAENQRNTAAVQRMEARIATMAAAVEQINSDGPANFGAALRGEAVKGHRDKKGGRG